jgi:phospholipase/carboxylesterase
MNKDLLPRLELCSCEYPDASVIWLHGLGADGHDFEPIVPELGSIGQRIRFIFPHAPAVPVTINGGYVMPAWYDIAEPGLSRHQDANGIRRSQHAIQQIVEHEIARGMPSKKIVLAGFSQGGAIALQTGLRFPQPLAGILALSTYLPLSDTVPDEVSSANRGLPILMAHGSADPIVPIDLGRTSRDLLAQLGYKVEWREYAMMHTIIQEEIVDIATWLARVFSVVVPT